jgi:hypothetical protein
VTWVAAHLISVDMRQPYSHCEDGLVIAYRTRDLNEDLGHLNKGLVEVLDGLCGILRRLVANISNAAVRKELDVCDGKLGEMLAHIVFSELGWQSAHKDARRLHDGIVINELWPATVKVARKRKRKSERCEKAFDKNVRQILASLRASAPIGRTGRLVAPAVWHWPAAPQTLTTSPKHYNTDKASPNHLLIRGHLHLQPLSLQHDPSKFDEMASEKSDLHKQEGKTPMYMSWLSLECKLTS